MDHWDALEILRLEKKRLWAEKAHQRAIRRAYEASPEALAGRQRQATRAATLWTAREAQANAAANSTVYRT